MVVGMSLRRSVHMSDPPAFEPSHALLHLLNALRIGEPNASQPKTALWVFEVDSRSDCDLSLLKKSSNELLNEIII